MSSSKQRFKKRKKKALPSDPSARATEASPRCPSVPALLCSGPMTADGTKVCPVPAAATTALHPAVLWAATECSDQSICRDKNAFCKISHDSRETESFPGGAVPILAREQTTREWPSVPTAVAQGTQSQHSPAAAPASTRAGTPISAAWCHLGQHPTCDTAGPGHSCRTDLTGYVAVPSHRCHCDSCGDAGWKTKVRPLGATPDFHCWSFSKTCTHLDLCNTNPATHHEHKDSSLALLGSHQSQGIWRQTQQLLQKWWCFNSPFAKYNVLFPRAVFG